MTSRAVQGVRVFVALLIVGALVSAQASAQSTGSEAAAPLSTPAHPPPAPDSPPLPVVETADGYVAPEELLRALAHLRIPPQARFALDYVTLDPRTGERRGLRFDPRLPSGARWSVSEAPQRANTKRVARRVTQRMEPIPNPDRELLLQTPSPDALIFSGLHSESAQEAVYSFRMKARTEAAERLVDRFVGRLTLDRATGEVREIVVESEGVIRSGLARVDAATMRYTLTRVEGCCTVIAKVEQSTRGSALFVPGVVNKIETYERIELAPDIALDPVPAK